jgi:predicted ArsR family transcriptional regulator
MPQKPVRKRDYRATDIAIKNAYKAYIKAHESMPTQQEIADICGINRKTVGIHLNKIELHDIIQPFKIFGDNVLMGLRNRAAKGDPAAVKLYLMLMYDWREQIVHEHKGETKHIFEVHYEDEK